MPKQGKKSKQENTNTQQASSKKQNNNEKNKKDQNKKNKTDQPKIQTSANPKSDILTLISHSFQPKQYISSKRIFEKYSEKLFDYSIITIGTKLQKGIYKHSTECFVDLCHSLDLNYSSIVDTNSISEFISIIRSKTTTTRNILFEYVHSNETFQYIFNYFLDLSGYLMRNIESVENIKKELKNRIQEFVSQKFVDSDKLLINYAANLLQPNDSVLVYSPTTILMNFFKSQAMQGKSFTVYLLEDSDPLNSKRVALLFVSMGIKVFYGHFSSLGPFLENTQKVFLGGNAIFSNGFLQTASGSSTIGLLAKNKRIPVYVLIKTYKFSDKTEMNSLSDNTAVVFAKNRMELKYDLMFSDFISLLITEVGCMPPTSVSMIIKEVKKHEFY